MSDRSVQKQVLERLQADGEKALKKGSELLDSLEVKHQDKIMKSFYDMISNIKGVLYFSTCRKHDLQRFSFVCDVTKR